jgi:lipopolysaccharide export system protein LptA
MPVHARHLRNWFLAAALVVIAVVAGFYLHGRRQVERAVRSVPRQQLGTGVSQSTSGFSLSKSEGGRTLFTIRADKAIQFGQRGRAELDKVDIIVYGKQGNRFDQIYGDKFSYDPQTGGVAADGEVHIDLEANAEGPQRPDQAQPAALKNPIHFKTRDLVFNQKTAFASTSKAVEFRIPQASGAAMGATYDARQNVLTLQSAVVLHTAGARSATIIAQHAVITKEPRQAVLQSVKLSQAGRTLEAERLTIDFRPDNSVERILATGDVRGAEEGENAMNFHASAAELRMGEKEAQSALFSGGVTVSGAGGALMNGSAQKVEVAFGPRSTVEKITALGNARFGEHPRPGAAAAAPVELAADAVDFLVGPNRRIDRAVTRGAAQITTAQNGQPAVITAGVFTAAFDARQHLKSLHGAPDAKVVAHQAGQPDLVTTSRAIDATFTPEGALATLVQSGDFRYTEGERIATAARARYTAADQVLTLTGSPRVVDGAIVTTADTLRFDRHSNDATAEGDVKSTYINLQARPGGALLASSDPIHVTARRMTARRATGIANYRDGARLWQGANIVEAPTIEFDRARRSLLATGSGPGDVKSVFVQQDASGKVTPVSVTAARLTYNDSDRRARFEGGVLLRGADGTISAGHVDVYLHARSAPAAEGPSQLDRVVAQNDVVIQQGARRATGRQLTYYAEGQKFVLTGGPPVIVDPQQGSTTGDSLTFYSRDDRVVVGSGPNARTVTRTKVSR